MFKRILFVLFLSAFLVALITGCNSFNSAPTLPPAPPLATSAPAGLPTVAPLAVATAIPVRTDVPDNSPLASPTLPPAPAATLPPVAATPTQKPQPTRTVAPSTGGLFSNVKIYLVAINDKGQSGPLIGCNDSVVAVDRPIQPTNAPLTAALVELLTIHQREYGESGLINALYQSDLHVQTVAIVSGVATIRLTGQLQSGGVCDDPRIIAQLDYTARQFSTVRATAIYVNGTLIQTLLSGKGP